MLHHRYFHIITVSMSLDLKNLPSLIFRIFLINVDDLYLHMINSNDAIILKPQYYSFPPSADSVGNISVDDGRLDVCFGQFYADRDFDPLHNFILQDPCLTTRIILSLIFFFIFFQIILCKSCCADSSPDCHPLK